MAHNVVLDPSGENILEPGHVEIRDELSFLKSVNDSGCFYIRGKYLCDWASDVARARGWKHVWRNAPSVELCQQCPSLSDVAAREFISRFSDATLIERPISLLQIATLRWPELDPEGKSAGEQAWTWLLWRAKAHLDGRRADCRNILCFFVLSHPELNVE